MFHECYMFHAPHLAGVGHTTHYGMITNDTPNILGFYRGFQNKDLEPWTSSVM